MFFLDAPDGYLLGDSGYPCRLFLLTTYRHPQLGPQTRFNNAHCKTRVRIEQSFGIVKMRFPCLRQLRVKPERAIKVVSSCFVLHNITFLQKDLMHMNEGVAIEDDFEHVDNNNDGVAVRNHVTLSIFT